MKVCLLWLAVCTMSLWAQAVAPDAAKQAPAPSATTVIATVNGKPITYGDYQTLVSSLAPQLQQNAVKDRKSLLRQFALMQRLSELGEQAKLDQKPPYKDSLAVARMNVLSQAELNEKYNELPVSPEEQKSYYEKNKDRYTQVKLKVIYLGFGSTPGAKNSATGKTYPTEAEAKTRAEGLVKQLRAGADFAALAKEHSEDAKSAASGGDFGKVSRADNLPEAIRSVVFSLKTGEISDPIRQPSGFWIFRAEESSTKPYDEVRDSIFTELKQARMREWLEATTKSLDIQFQDEAFFAGTGGGGPAK